MMKRYVVILERGTRNWSAYVPDLPGCVAAARTRTETERLIGEAIEFHVDTMRAEGEPIPEPTTEALQVAVSA
jgi:predicted RNase H-like HicB family nuclease